MSNQSLEKVRIIIQAIGAVGVIFAGLSVFLWSRSIKTQIEATNTQTEWNRKHFTVSTLKDFAGDFKEQAGHVMKRFRYHKKDSMVIINEDTARSIYYAEEETDDFQFRRDLMGLLNYAKFLCTAYELEVVDSAFTRREYSCLLFTWYESFGEEFIKVAHEGYECPAGALPYTVIDTVMKKWGYHDYVAAR